MKKKLTSLLGIFSILLILTHFVSVVRIWIRTNNNQHINKKDILIDREITKNQNDVTIIKSRPEDLNVDAMLIATKDEVSGELVVRGEYGNKRFIKSFKDMLLFGDMRLIKKQSNIQGVVFIGMLHNSQVTSGMNSYIGEFPIYDGQVAVVTEDELTSLFSINELLEFMKRKRSERLSKKQSEVN